MLQCCNVATLHQVFRMSMLQAKKEIFNFILYIN